MTRLLALAALVAPLLASGAAHALNPQPLPPKALGSSFVNPGIKALNPQPLPPKSLGSSFVNPGIKALNPQPLPPRWNPPQIRAVR